jgi:tetratricopeptide (TPR) repeat protein
MAFRKHGLLMLLSLLFFHGPGTKSSLAWQEETPQGQDVPAASKEKATVSVLVREGQPEQVDEQVKPAAAEEPVEKQQQELSRKEVRGESLSLEPTSFSGLIPGKSTAEEIRQEFGEPTSSLDQSGTLVQTYRVDPYDRVGVVVREGLLESIHLQFSVSVELEEFCQQLELPPGEGIDLPVTVIKVHERVYPERGVSLLYRTVDNSPIVQQVDFHSIRQRDFQRAARQLEESHYARTLDLVRISQRINPELAEAFAIEARVASRVGQTALALNALTRVHRLDPGDHQSRLLQARLWAWTQRKPLAIKQAREIRNNSQVTPLVRARATLLLADLVGEVGQANAALEYFKEAITRATETARESAGNDRDEAILVLIEAHRAVAREIARGDWQEEEKGEAIDRWLGVADELAEQLKSRQSAPPLLDLDGLAVRLDIQLNLQNFDETGVIEKLVQQGESLIEQSQDELTSGEVHWRIGRALFVAAQIARERDAPEQAITHGTAAYRHLHDAASPREQGLQGQALVGGNSFLVGSLEAISRKDHEQAVRWYERALPHLAQPGMERHWTSRGWHGERFVSMGLSFWKTGARDRGLELTEQGLAWVEQAVKEDSFPRRHLAVPYANIGIMYQAMGQEKQAREIAVRAASLRRSDDSGFQRR